MCFKIILALKFKENVQYIIFFSLFDDIVIEYIRFVQQDAKYTFTEYIKHKKKKID